MEKELERGNERLIPWQGLIKQLESFVKLEQYHRILSALELCVERIKKRQLGCAGNELFEQVSYILSICKKLDKMGHEKRYRKDLGKIVLKPLLESIKDQLDEELFNKIKGYIHEKLPYEVAIKYSTLCNHEKIDLEELLVNDSVNPYHLLQEIHVHFKEYAQHHVEDYGAAAIVIRVLDYWRTMLYSEFKYRDIRPLIELGEELIVLIKQSHSEVKKRALWRMVLLLQMLLRDHPTIIKLNSKEWPTEGFASSLIPVEDNISFSSPSIYVLKNDSGRLLKDYQSQLKDSRVVFEEAVKGTKSDIFSAQRTHTQQVIEMLQEMVSATIKLLGEAPCKIAVCALGSTSRNDRRPNSDVEYMILHSEVPEDKKKKVDVYIGHFISVFELMILRLGETPTRNIDSRAGIHVDKSVLETKSWGTPEAVAKRFVTELMSSLQGSVVEVTNVPISPGNTKNASSQHAWLDRGFYEFLHPVLIHPGQLGGDTLRKSYLDHLDNYLKQAISDADQPEKIQQYFNLKTNIWWKGLTRQQGIALVSLYDLVKQSESTLRNLKMGDKLKIKDVFNKPLIYCAMNLRMYYRWDCHSPRDVIAHYAKQLSWGREALEAWWSAALSFVIKHQIALTAIDQPQQDVVSYSLNTDEEKIFWAGMDLIAEGFILPLSQVLHECFLGSKNIDLVPYAIIKTYLNVRNKWLDKWIKKGLERDHLLTHPLMRVLSKYPDESGWSLQMEQLLKGHHNGLLTLSEETESACQFEGLPLAGKPSKRYFRASLIEQCFKNGEFFGDPKLSSENSKVKKIILDNKTWYIKVKEGNREGLMGREYLAMMLHLLLGGEPQIALGWPIKLTCADPGKPKSFYAWISEGIEGESLGKIMRESPESWISWKFDRENFTQLFLLSFLTCPEDGQPENFKVIDKNGRTQLFAIDYGQCFVKSKRTIKVFFGKDKQALALKTMVYLFEAMDEELSQDMITCIRLLDIEQWFINLTNAAKSINELFKPLLEEDLQVLPESERGQYNTTLLDLDDGVLNCIKTRLELLQNWLRTTTQVITGRNILRDLDPLIALQYESLQHEIKTPEDFYQKLDAQAYTNINGKMVSSLSMKKLKEGTMTPAYLALSSNLEPKYFRRVHFRGLDKTQQEYQLQLLEAVAETKGKAFIKLNLSGCPIDEDRLIRLLKKMTHLQELDLRECQGIKVMTIANLLGHRPNAIFFTYNHDVLCPSLQVIHYFIDDRDEVLKLNVSLIQRQLLTKTIRNFMQRVDRVIQVLMELLRDHDSKVCRSAAAALGKLGKVDARVMEGLLEALSDSDEWVRKWAAVALGHLGKADDRVMGALFKALRDRDRHDRDRYVRGSAALSLGHLGKADDRVIKALFKALSDSEWYVRLSVAEALGKIGKGDARVIEALLKALSDSDWNVRASAAEASGLLLNPINFWNRIQEEIQLLAAEIPHLLSNTDNDNITKRIFFLVDDERTTHALPCVCRKWRDLYAEFQEDQLELRVQSAPEMQMATVFGRHADDQQKVSMDKTNNSLTRFFGQSRVAKDEQGDTNFIEELMLDKVALASQREVNCCELHEQKNKCRVVAADPDGDCGFTGTHRVLEVMGKPEIASKITREQFIALVDTEFKKGNALKKSLICKIFKQDRILDNDENTALAEWCEKFSSKGYWMQEAHFELLSTVYNIEFRYYCLNEHNVFIPEIGNEVLYCGDDDTNKVVVDLAHVTVKLRDETATLNHFEGLIINATTEQERRIDELNQTINGDLESDHSNGFN